MPHDAASYDDEQQLTAYVWHNYRNLLTPLESLADKTLLAESKAEHASERMAAAMRQRWINGVRSQFMTGSQSSHSAVRS